MDINSDIAMNLSNEITERKREKDKYVDNLLSSQHLLSSSVMYDKKVTRRKII